MGFVLETTVCELDNVTDSLTILLTADSETKLYHVYRQTWIL